MHKLILVLFLLVTPISLFGGHEEGKEHGGKEAKSKNMAEKKPNPKNTVEKKPNPKNMAEKKPNPKNTVAKRPNLKRLGKISDCRMRNQNLIIAQLTTVLMTIFLSGSLLQASEERPAKLSSMPKT